VEFAQGEVELAVVEAVGLLSLMGGEEALPLPSHELVQEPLEEEREGGALSLFHLGIDLINQLVEPVWGLRTWERIREEFERLALVDLRTKDGDLQLTSELTVKQRKVLKELEIQPPKRVRSARLTPAKP
jgi:hypothetical protein